MIVGELIGILASLPQGALVRMEIANKSCALVHSVDYEWDGSQQWIILNDYQPREPRPHRTSYCDEATDSSHSSANGL